MPRQHVLFQLRDKTGEVIKSVDRNMWVHFNDHEQRMVVDVSLFEGKSTVEIHLTPEGILVVDITREVSKQQKNVIARR